MRTSYWTWRPVERPLTPPLPIISPRRSCCPTATVRGAASRGLVHAERALAEAHESVSHRHFGGQRLQGVEKLIRVLRARSQLLITMLQGLLLAAQGVVISGLPQHSSVGPGGGENG